MCTWQARNRENRPVRVEGWLLGKALGAATVMKDMKAKVHTRGGPGRRPALARARQGRRIFSFIPIAPPTRVSGKPLRYFKIIRTAPVGGCWY